MKDHRISVRLTAELRRRINATAARTGIRASDVVRQAVERQFAVQDGQMTAYERAERSGLIGVIRSGPRDLSTNPKHFDDFGRS
jgi:predicted DNA-binding protein